MTLISVDEALRRVLSSVKAPLDSITIPVEASAGYRLARDVAALRDQPPFPASAMDGYAVRSEDSLQVPAVLKIIGTSAAGQRFSGEVSRNEAVRIFTGAPVPEGADAVVLQEDTDTSNGAVTVRERPTPGLHIRPSGLDFRQGAVLLSAGERIDARHIALAAAMGHGSVRVRRKPRVALLATGDELVRPGETAGPDQIVASSLPALAAMVAKAGGEPLDLGIARDTEGALEEALDKAEALQPDILITLGGASVGEHDLVQATFARRGLDLGFWRIALRPGKPLMHGKLGSMLFLGLPGNPVSSLVCAILFLIPAIRALSGDPEAGQDPTEEAMLGSAVGSNRDRQDYQRAIVKPERIEMGGIIREIAVVYPHAIQDSSMLGLLQTSQALLVRPPQALAAKAGDPCRIIHLSQFC